jgi:hypothetical protein
MKMGVQRYAPAAGPPRKIPGTIVPEEARRVGMDSVEDRKSLAYTAVRSADDPAHSESLYRLRDPSLFISGLPLPNLIENAPLVGVVKHTDERKGVCALPVVLAFCDLIRVIDVYWFSVNQKQLDLWENHSSTVNVIDGLLWKTFLGCVL